ncbi:hypothetical protein HELRODRAFT_184040 [Helobdella robusta]|uniref:Endoplasmic reticulum lectin 1 n=1 Tax=Helobdella robusta TaxID=6412 RepID=T1FKH0_HELRO|nr:hypothetical protein HELRODRAFT_184040 [Helobdella robusta]ESO08691.1 hypothetical protein HELRODRAFT_184040 [Helobdella robusta]
MVIKHPGPKENIILTTNNQETYQCTLPEVIDEKTRLKNEEQFSSASLELEYLRPLLDDDICTYRPLKVQEYYLGKYSREKYKKDLEKARKDRDEGKSIAHPKKKKVLGVEYPYYEVVYEDGSVCDLTGQPRRSHIQFICYSGGSNEIYELKETSSCEYEIVVLTKHLCQHPSYGPRKSEVHTIDCHLVGNSPMLPSNLRELQFSNAFAKHNKEAKHQQILNTILDVQTLIDEDDDDDDDDVGSGDKTKQPQQLKTDTGAAEATTTSTPKEKHVDMDSVFSIPPSSKHILREFLSGDYCIEGGTGWWKHEFCFGKFIRQYHDEHDFRREIKLGVWNEEKHLQWVNSNSYKKPKPYSERKSLYNLYGDGDYCEEVKKNRMVEVESSLFCDMIRSADDNGLIDYKI